MDSKKIQSSSSKTTLTKTLIASSGSKLSLVGKHHVLPDGGKPVEGSTTHIAGKGESQISIASVVDSLNSFIIHAKEDWDDDGRKGQYAYGTYRTEMRFALVETLAALHRFFTWPPRGKFFFSSGYYPDISEGGDVGLGGIIAPPVKEIWIMNLDSDVTATLQKMFVGSPKITFKKGYNGLPMAVVTYGNKIERDKGQAVMKYQSGNDADVAYKKAISNMNSVDLGDRGICWKQPNENYVVKVLGNVTVEDIFKRVPHAQNVHFLTASDGDRVAVAAHVDDTMQEKSFRGTVLPKLGSQILRWQRDKPVFPSKAQPKSNTPTPTATSSSASKPKPTPEKEKEGKSDVKQGTTKKSAVAPAKTSDASSNDGDDAKSDKSTNVEDEVKGAAKMSPEELAQKLWKPPVATYSNLSNLFKPTLYIKKCPKSMTRSELLKLFKGASRIDIKSGIGIIEFDDPVKAAKAFHAAHQIRHEGSQLKITTFEPAILKPNKKKRKKWKKKVGKFFNFFKKTDDNKEKAAAEKPGKKPPPNNNNSKKEIKKVEMKKK